ncbi:hypothetical protein MJO29_005131 [Puccinia striiformis f. sp. tritici]|nr:hypothetical protein MJO29_005131 [Puccinia striiformis f. sp. tritici]
MEAVGHHVVESTPHPPTNGLAPFVYSQVIRVRVRQRIREILFRSSLESYSRLQSLHGEPPIHSLLPLIKAFVLELPQAFRRQHLPPGLPTNHDSMSSLVTFLRAMVKHCNLLLINVQQES